MKKHTERHSQQVEMPKEGFVRLPVVLKVLGIGKTAFQSGINAGRYPKPYKLGPRIAVWKVEEIRALIAKVSDQEPNEDLDIDEFETYNAF